MEKESRITISARRVSVSAAVFVLICFFLPWVQVSCGGQTESASGFDLARDGNGALWLIPLLMSAFVVIGLTQIRRILPTIFALLGVVSGLFSAYLMNRERMDAERDAVLSAHATGWLWLSLFLSLVLAASSFLFFLKREKSD